ncbi:hypothetical protein Fmac_018774 [Flemingia macrophylla]|uniref:Uncharacterized protein n=1 Tax=Flemingia macrophylla TaxID=520843 RepID=A0ABD1M5Y8_9FABA
MGLKFLTFDTPFPRNNACPQDTTAASFMDKFFKEVRLAKRRFLFDAEAISRLKAQGSNLTAKNPTRVEVVTSLLCKCVAKACKANTGLERPTLVSHAVNMRRRASPNFSNSCMGNFSWMATALVSENDELPELVSKFREAVNSVNSNLVKSFRGKEGWCNFGLYDVDFGWGKPMWVSCMAECQDLVILMDTPSGKGTEVWVHLNEDKMDILQQDNELLMFATLDSNPLQLKD